MTVTGVRATLHWGYQEAAALDGWTVTKKADGSGWSLTATVRSANSMRISQRPLVFVAPHSQGVWRWPVIEDTLQMTDASLTATLGPKER